LSPLDVTIVGTSAQSESFPVNNLIKPVVSFTKRETEDPRGASYFTGDITLGFTITDSSSTGSYTVYIDYTTNNGLSWKPITATGSLAGLSDNTVLIWESYRDYPSTSTPNNARIRIICHDGDLLSDPVYCPASFTLQNYHLPNNTNLKFVDVDSTGYYGNAALTNDGKVWLWGTNPSGYYLGDSNANYSPTQVTNPNWQDVIDVACTYAGVLALGRDKTIRCAGYSNYGEFGYGGQGSNFTTNSNIKPTGLDGVITAISCSYAHTLALHEDGTVRAFGYNNYGQLGDGTNSNRNIPIQVTGLSGITAISAGGYSTVNFSLALKNDGTVWAWGYNGQGQLGLGNTTTRYVPEEIPSSSFGGVKVKAIAAGANHSLFLLENGKVFYCGHDGAASRGSIPIEVIVGSTPLNDIQKIYAGMHANSQGNSFAVDSRGSVYGWGYNSPYGHLGLNNTSTQSTPVKLPGLSRISAIAVSKSGSTYFYATYVSNAPTGNSGIWNAGYGSSYYQMTSSNSGVSYYFYHQ
jgi:alpha-tubulin suppressor-like RCC1 family protein